MGKLAVISGVLFMLLCTAAQAHRPIFSEKAATDPNTAVLISQPAISQVIYRELTEEAKEVWLAFDANEGFGLFIQIGVPVLDHLKEFRPAMLVIGTGLPAEIGLEREPVCTEEGFHCLAVVGGCGPACGGDHAPVRGCESGGAWAGRACGVLLCHFRSNLAERLNWAFMQLRAGQIIRCA